MQIVELEMVPLSLRPVLQRLYDMKTTQSALREGVLFSTKRNNYYYDTGTGKVIVLDDDTSYIFRVLFDPTLSAETFLISLTKVDPNAVKNLLQTIDAERLFQRPPLLSMGKEIAAGVTDTEQKVEQIILEVTEQCNFRCKYCVYSEDFSGNRDFGNRRMPTEIAFKAIDWALENSGAKLAITFYGGEPLLNFKLMKAVIERSQAKRGNKEIVYSFTSNMSLMTREIATYLAQVPNLYIMASIDGPRTVHDAYRVYANDAPTFEDSIGGLRILADAYAGSHMPVNINAVLTPPFGFEKLEQVNAYFESLDWLPATCHVNITYPSYGTCPGLDEYYDKITGNPKYDLEKAQQALQAAYQAAENSAAAWAEKEANAGSERDALQRELNERQEKAAQYAREIAEKQAQRELLQQEESPDEEIISRIEAELTQLTAEETQNREALAEAEARLNEADAALESVQSQREEAARTAAQAAEQAEQARNDARHAYEKSVEAASETAAANAASATVLAEQIREMESSVETLKKLDEQEGVFCAPQTGTVESLQLMQGQTSGQVGGSISDPERGYQIRFALEAEDAVQDTAGVTVTVMQGAKSESVKINSSVSQQDGGVVLSAALTGSDWQVGKAELTIRLSETEYDCCLPVSALHSDNGGDFVYSVEERNTILGLQNIVRKVYVEVVERNNELAALRNYTTGAPVVAATTKSLQEGARVRTAG